MNNKISFYTDMADERIDLYKKVNNLSNIDGIKIEDSSNNGVTTTVVDVINENGSNALQKDIGKYITIETSDIKYIEEKQKEEIINTLANKIKEFIGDDHSKSILVVGLGNATATPDSLGPKVVETLDITRHLLNFASEFLEPNTRSISAISPGVLGTTGIETSEIVSSVVKNVKPDIIIAIDALASSTVARVGNSIQLSDTGITPGAGVRNKREGLNQKTMNVPVIAIGVPTVVDMATITEEALEKIVNSNGEEENLNEFKNTVNDNRKEKIAKALDTENYIVTPKEVDELIQIMADIVSSGINMAVN